jgi:hypothetical protein
VITFIPIYLSIAMDLPAWLLQFLEKRIHAFFRKGSEAVSGGHCLVAWDQVCRPVEYGGLGVLNLKILGFALCAGCGCEGCDEAAGLTSLFRLSQRSRVSTTRPPAPF